MPAVVWHDRKVKNAVRSKLRRGARRVGREMRDEARSEARAMVTRRSGRLFKGIRHEVRESRSRGSIVAAVGFTRDAFYGYFLVKPARHIRRPRPFLQRAYERTEPKILGIIARA